MRTLGEAAAATLAEGERAAAELARETARRRELRLRERALRQRIAAQRANEAERRAESARVENETARMRKRASEALQDMHLVRADVRQAKKERDAHLSQLELTAAAIRLAEEELELERKCVAAVAGLHEAGTKSVNYATRRRDHWRTEAGVAQHQASILRDKIESLAHQLEAFAASDDDDC